ncbi:hypothetical protein JCM15519_31500 [Fundidesulfovibrio butyratiphilus]
MPVNDSIPAQRRAHILDELKSRFSWPVEEAFMREDFSVRTDFAARVHRVDWPRQALGRDPSFGRYLHEMAHALLGETAHPQFCHPFFASRQDKALVATYQPLFDMALDWFVEGLLMEIAPEVQGADIDERFRQAAGMLRQGMALPSLAFVVDTGLSLASFEVHRGLPMATQGKMAQVVRAFTRTPPAPPTLFALRGLTASLMEVFENHTARLVRDKDFERWRIAPAL